MCALCECGEVKSALVHAALERGREGHEGCLHVVQGAFNQAVVVLGAKQAIFFSKVDKNGRSTGGGGVRAVFRKREKRDHRPLLFVYAINSYVKSYAYFISA